MAKDGTEAAKGSWYAALGQAETLKLQARLEDLTVWEMEKVKESCKGSKTYTYGMTSWREGQDMQCPLGEC